MKVTTSVLIAIALLHIVSCDYAPVFNRYTAVESGTTKNVSFNTVSLNASVDQFIAGSTGGAGFIAKFPATGDAVIKKLNNPTFTGGCSNYQGGLIGSDYYFVFSCKATDNTYSVFVAKAESAAFTNPTFWSFTHSEMTVDPLVKAAFGTTIFIAHKRSNNANPWYINSLDTSFNSNWEYTSGSSVTINMLSVDTSNNTLLALGSVSKKIVTVLEIANDGSLTSSRQITYNTAKDEENSELKGTGFHKTTAGERLITVVKDDDGGDDVSYVIVPSANDSATFYELENASGSVHAELGVFDGTRYYVVGSNVSSDVVVGFPTTSGFTSGTLYYNAYNAYSTKAVAASSDSLYLTGSFALNSSTTYGWLAKFADADGTDTYARFKQYLRPIIADTEATADPAQTTYSTTNSTTNFVKQTSNSSYTGSTSTAPELSSQAATYFTVQEVTKDDADTSSAGHLFFAVGTFVAVAFFGF
mmetsp:Transcript_15599/g.17328  ORF Transcript_15599/g.17328 Transcript_15599/m.17328 type:complete len:473 (-) Transcript_15599:1471-2889(-)